MEETVFTSEDGEGVQLQCGNCRMLSGVIPLPPAGTVWCSCGEWAFNFDIVGRNDMPPEEIEPGPLGPNGSGEPVPLTLLDGPWT